MFSYRGTVSVVWRCCRRLVGTTYPLLLHGVDAVLPAAGEDLLVGETRDGGGLKHVVGDLLEVSGSVLLTLLEILGAAIVRLELLDQGVHVGILVLILGATLGGVGRDVLLLLIVAHRLRGGRVISHVDCCARGSLLPSAFPWLVGRGK